MAKKESGVWGGGGGGGGEGEGRGGTGVWARKWEINLFKSQDPGVGGGRGTLWSGESDFSGLAKYS